MFATFTGVYVENKRGQMRTHWRAIWKLETTRGKQFVHEPLGVFDTKGEAEDFALANPPQCVLDARKVAA